MELFQLRYFVAAARTGSFTRAAQLCHVSQPSLSQQILNLEAELGQRLFDRLGRKVLLTPAGRTLLEHALAVLHRVDAAKREIAEGHGSLKGRVTIAAIPTVAPYLLPPVLQRIQQGHAELEVFLEEGLTEQVLASVVSGEADCGIVALPVEGEQLEVEKIATEHFYVALPENDPLAGRPNCTLAELKGRRFLLLDEIHCLGELISRFCLTHGLEPRLVSRCSQLCTIQRLIAANQGISLLPAMVCSRDQNPSFRYRPLAGDAPKRTIAAVWHRRRGLPKAVGIFLSELKKEAHCLLACAPPGLKEAPSPRRKKGVEGS
jgi:LysR family hydrogen peroxide-inducible transcriptional activator